MLTDRVACEPSAEERDAWDYGAVTILELAERCWWFTGFAANHGWRSFPEPSAPWEIALTALGEPHA